MTDISLPNLSLAHTLEEDVKKQTRTFAISPLIRGVMTVKKSVMNADIPIPFVRKPKPTTVMAVEKKKTDAPRTPLQKFAARPAASGAYYVAVTAYSSTVDQTDASPCITANGFNVCKHGIEDTIAANFLPFGTRIKFPELYGDRIFVVRDRMNRRYTQRADIWMKNRTDAIKFGLKKVKIEVVPAQLAAK